MSCALSRSGVDFTAAKDSMVNLLIVGKNYSLVGASVTTTDPTGAVNTVDFSGEIDLTKTKVTIKVLQGHNTVDLTLFPPPAPETLAIKEDCGSSVTKSLITFGPGLHADANFDVIAS
jgi:hypothetical protein